MRHTLIRLASLSALAAPAAAQQFQQATAFPGTAFWSEGVECADVDHDGDLDIFVADGDGFATAGTQRQSRLFVNQLAQGTAFGLVDESVARLGAHTSNAKGVATGDIDGDGWVDALYANAFSTQLPFLYVNRGAAQPGYFNFEGSTRGFTTLLNSGSAAFADIDDDGDLDALINDAYNTAAATTRRPRLYRNNGAGVFSEDAVFSTTAPLKPGQMDVQFADIDNDWDLDFFGPNKGTAASSTHYMMTNNGTGAFTDRSNLIASASGNTYEAEPGDLDGDNDLDLFFVSLSGFAEGGLRNNLNTGTLGYTQIQTIGASDDNEIALVDYDVDGDYDIFVGSLGASEVAYANNGAGTVAAAANIIQAQADSTLDLSVADLDNDGRYDLVTVQGESGVFTNKFYRNTGAIDTRAPVVTGVNAPVAGDSAGPWVCKAKVRDQVLDDGVNYVRGWAEWIEVDASSHSYACTINGASLALPASAAAGAMVDFVNGDAGAVSLVVAGPRAWSATIQPGASFRVGLVVPGSYSFTTSSGGSATVVVGSGAYSSLEGLHQGGQMYRFALTRPAGSTGGTFARQLRFVDWAGNTAMVALPDLVVPGLATGTPFCFGDGSGAACPCGNASAAGAAAGCLNSLGTAGALRGVGSASIASDSFRLDGSAMANSSALYFQGTTQAGAGLGTVFGDGLRCAAGSVIRLGTKVNAAGSSSFPLAGDPSVSVRGAVPAGATRVYQIWYRNAAAYCAAETFNLTNGLSVVWAP